MVSATVSQDVQIVVLICLGAFSLYVMMVCCLVFQKPATLAAGLSFDIDKLSFVSKLPEEEQALFHYGTNVENLWKYAKGFYGRIVIHHGKVKFKVDGVTTELNRRKYGTFRCDEKFELLDRTEELMFHMDLFRLSESNDQLKKE